MENIRRRRYDKWFLTGYMVMYSYNRRNIHIQDSRRLYYFIRENKLTAHCTLFIVMVLFCSTPTGLSLPLFRLISLNTSKVIER